MNKRLLKRHKRQVLRAKEHAKLSEPDVRTPEEIKAAREASRPAGGRHSGNADTYAGPSRPTHAGAAAHSPAKADA